LSDDHKVGFGLFIPCAVLVRIACRYKRFVRSQPNRPDETNRIRQAGGNVYFHGVWRVGGILAVSR
jgi:hypothetical protein